MAKKKPVKTKLKSKSLVLYVENSTMKGKTFKDAKSAQSFADKFKKQNPIFMDGYWVELIVADIQGTITPSEDSPLEID